MPTRIEQISPNFWSDCIRVRPEVFFVHNATLGDQECHDPGGPVLRGIRYQRYAPSVFAGLKVVSVEKMRGLFWDSSGFAGARVGQSKKALRVYGNGVIGV